jgi:hypothetical protein
MGGLLVATILTLIVLPALYVALSGGPRAESAGAGVPPSDPGSAPAPASGQRAFLLGRRRR